MRSATRAGDALSRPKRATEISVEHNPELIQCQYWPKDRLIEPEVP